MLNSECINVYYSYLTEVKKASQNTLSSYLRDIRQLSDYLTTHSDANLDSVAEEDLADYFAWLKNNGK